MNDIHTHEENYTSPAERLRQLAQRPSATQAAEAVEQAIRGDTLETFALVNPDERRANAVNAVLHAKGILATITPEDASAIWRIVLELETVSG